MFPMEWEIFHQMRAQIYNESCLLHIKVTCRCNTHTNGVLIWLVHWRFTWNVPKDSPECFQMYNMWWKFDSEMLISSDEGKRNRSWKIELSATKDGNCWIQRHLCDYVICVQIEWKTFFSSAKHEFHAQNSRNVAPNPNNRSSQIKSLTSKAAHFLSFFPFIYNWWRKFIEKIQQFIFPVWIPSSRSEIRRVNASFRSERALKFEYNSQTTSFGIVGKKSLAFIPRLSN